MITFNYSPKEYFKFVGAKSFFNEGEGRPFDYPKNRLEIIGEGIVKPVFVPTDRILKNIMNPLMTVALTVIAIAIATIIFYPVTFIAAIEATIPFIFKIEPWMLRLGFFAVSEITILGLCLRTIGRLTNTTLMSTYGRREIIPLALGTILVNR